MQYIGQILLIVSKDYKNMFKSGIKSLRKKLILFQANLSYSSLDAGEALYDIGEKELAADYFRKTIHDTNEHHNARCTAHLYMAALAYQARDITKTRNHLEAAQESEYVPTKERTKHFDIMRKKFHDKDQETDYIITDEEAKTLHDQFNRMSFSPKGISGLDNNFSSSAKVIDEEIIAETSYELGRYYLNAYFEEKEKGDASSKETSIAAITHAKKFSKLAFASKHLNPDERVNAGIMLASITKQTKPSDFDETYKILEQAKEIPEASPRAKAKATWKLATLINSNRVKDCYLIAPFSSEREPVKSLPQLLDEVIENSANEAVKKEAKLLVSVEAYRRNGGIRSPEYFADNIMQELVDLGQEGSNKIKKDAYIAAGIIKKEHGKKFEAENLLKNALEINIGLDSFDQDEEIAVTLMRMNTSDGNVSNSIQYATQFIDKHSIAPKGIRKEVQLIESLNPKLAGLTETIDKIANDLMMKQNVASRKQGEPLPPEKLPSNTFTKIVGKFPSGFKAVSESSYCNDKELKETLTFVKKEKSAGK
jgi:tetratricopeptide (TPR) repeat protein